MRYIVQVSVNIRPDDEYAGGQSLYFSRSFALEGNKYSDIAKQVDFIYDSIEPRNVVKNDQSNDRRNA